MKVLKFGLDYLALSVLESGHFGRFDSHFSGLSDNSNFKDVHAYGYFFTVIYTKTKDKSILTYQYRGYPVFQLQRLEKQGAMIGISHFIRFYGAFFLFPELHRFLKLLTMEFDNLKVSRVDLALDIDVSVSDFLDCGFTTRLRAGAEFYDSSGNVQTKYFGRRKNNRKHFFRVYDKLADTELKSKIALYTRYLDYDNVTRLELEAHSETVSRYGVDIDFIFNESRQLDLFKSLANSSLTTNFCILDKLVLMYWPSVISAKSSSKHHIVNKLRSKTMFLAYARSLLASGFNPYEVLDESAFDLFSSVEKGGEGEIPPTDSIGTPDSDCEPDFYF